MPNIFSDVVQDVLGTLVKLSEPDRPSGIQAEVLRAVQNMVVLLDEVQEQLDGKLRARGAAGNVARSQPSDYELDRMCLLSLC
jgi:hypothetical protein